MKPGDRVVCVQVSDADGPVPAIAVGRCGLVLYVEDALAGLAATVTVAWDGGVKSPRLFAWRFRVLPP